MRMLALALRNLSRQKRRSFLLGAAVAFGFLVLTCANGVAGGIARGFERNISTLATGHLYFMTVERTPGSSRMYLILRDETSLIEDALRKAGIPYLHLVKRTQALTLTSLLHAGKASSRSVEGVDWNQDRLLRDNLVLAKGGLEGLEGSSGIVLAESAARSLQVDVGDSVLIQTQTIHGQMNVEEAEVKAIYRDAAGVFQVSCFVDREFMNRILGMPPGSANTVGIVLPSLSSSREALEKLHAELERRLPPGSLVPLNRVRERGMQNTLLDLRKDADFREGRRHVLFSLENEPFFKSFLAIIGTVQWSSLAVVTFLLFLIMAGLSNMYRIVVRERRREFGTLRALGMQSQSLTGLILSEALLLTMLAALLGTVLGLLLLAFLGLGDNLWILPNEVGELNFFLIDKKLAWEIDWAVLAVCAALLVGLTLFCAWWPARTAARMSPAEALRT